MPALDRTARVREFSRPIYLAGETALRVLRAGNPAAFDPVARRIELPPTMPSKPELDRAAETVRSICRGFRTYGSVPDASSDAPLEFCVGNAPRRRAANGYRAHFSTATFSSGSFLRVAGNLFVACPALALAQIALRAPEDIELIELIWEVCGTYRTVRTGTESAYQTHPLGSPDEILAYLALNKGLYGAKKLKRALPFVAPGSASPRETKLALLLGLPVKRGGYGLGMPRMNHRVEASFSAQAISGRSSFRCDLCWLGGKVDVEYQSREIHQGEESRIRDSRRANALASMGWTVISVTNDELDSCAAMNAIAEAVGRATGKRVRVRVDDYRARQMELRRKLALPAGPGIVRW